MTRSEWATAFADEGLIILQVTEDPTDPNTLTVYLDGYQGQWAGGVALATIKQMPGIVGAVAARQAPAIIRVWTA